MAIKAVDLRKGMGIRYQDQLWVVHSCSIVAKGNKRSYMAADLKSVRDGRVIQERFRVDESVEPAIFDHKDLEYLYTKGDQHMAMDHETYEEVEIPDSMVGEARVYLTPNIHIQVAFVEGKIVSVELPNTVELKITDVPPAIRGATVTNQLKEAVCETGARVKVPSFIANGEVVRVDTRTGEYLGRA
jgi:elongation factor P